MTEDEAKKYWCPFSGDRMIDDQGRTRGYNCIGSECMAWRWNMAQAGINYGAGELPTDGHCGLAGKL